MEPAKRETMPEETAKAMEEKLLEMFPAAKKVVWIGDEKPENIPPEVQAASEAYMNAMEARMAQSLKEGICHDCGVKMPGVYPPPDDDDDWKPAEGWTWFSDPNDDDMPLFWVCPKCDAEDE